MMYTAGSLEKYATCGGVGTRGKIARGKSEHCKTAKYVDTFDFDDQWLNAMAINFYSYVDSKAL